ncbi:hypothetical protein VOLCADRAFT_82490 [Volvox carteri f. nagariensis]|uniref:NEDD8-activating enzyme E1 regulatory subunit n=1 Tax=Volvox carteri f. nagariensis TaxID=3068 RepID=D8U5A5_VOLCA|nr:uncharacterized protein VOLCADRAFT_82490 [Volvox carteri f. nagariensis]EFJ45116.1 hypothetical protein VOLCADRAFT_82490 [Volvox carteri f. nagariensis]|eukprot:XP_002953792.1 hypothetical protein VOLCADRAFT_82490 [Volvox carteri f. nagariensis]
MAPVPDPKAKRYDRQLRIWGTHGQQRLESCSICLLKCGPTGSETLKNLVLGGIASFTIVDGEKVEARDLGNNFLVSASSQGEPRAKVVTELLQELNESVSGSYVEEVPEVLITDNPQFFHSFDLVIATQMREQDMVKLDEICRSTGRAKLLIIRSYGLVGYLRASLPEHHIVESKPDSQLDDLRLHQPWPELLQFASSFDLSSLDDIAHSHMPYVVILLQAAERWRAAHGGLLPGTSSADKSAFKAQVASMRRTVDGEENFDEALKAAFHVSTPYRIPSEVRALLDDEAAGAGLGPGSDEFWVMVAALKEFVEDEGAGTLPLEGSIPDMHATTDMYLRVQHLYREKAERDVAAVEAHVRQLLARLGQPADSISHDTVRLYCRHARHLRCVRYRTLAEETGPETARGSVLAAALSAGGGGGLGFCGDLPPGSSDAALYVLLRAADRFHAQTGRYPGAPTADPQDDLPLLRQAAMQSPDSSSGSGAAIISEDLLAETCRAGAAELHVVAAFMGGVAAQEAIKLVTRQFVPIAGTLIYNAMSCTTTALEL